MTAEDRRRYRDSYPEKVDLTPGTKTHDRIVDFVMERAFESERFMQQKHTKWQFINEMCNAFITLTDEEIKKSANDPNRPISIVIPEMYATRETLLTYMLSVFGSGGPLHRYKGVGPEDTLGAIMLEKIIETQTRRSKALLALHTHFSDAFTYGFGVVTNYWYTKVGKRSVLNPVGYFDPFQGFIQTGEERVLQDSIMYEGNVTVAIDPYRYLPDPSVPIYKVQEGEYVGWKASESYMSMLRRERSLGSTLFNVQYLRDCENMSSSIYTTSPSGRDKDLSDTSSPERFVGVRRADTIYMYADIIPRELELSKNEYPEKWLFGVTADQLVVSAAPLNLQHDMFPVSVCAPDAEGHEFLPTSRLEMMSGGQRMMNWYFNSHMTNVMKSINNVLVVDPKIINLPDVYDNKPGKVIRTRPPVWGRGVKDGLEQLKVDDVTRGHMGDLMLTRDLTRNTIGITDATQGIQRNSGPERVTKAEFMGTQGNAVSRLQKAASLISLQSMHDQALMHAHHTQQFMTQQAYVETVGRWEMTLRNEFGIMDPSIRVDPFQLNVGFDVETHDGSIIRGDNGEIWIQLMQLVTTNPELLMTIDSTRSWLHIARLLGADNPQDFLKKAQMIQPQVVPNEQMAGMMDKGQVQPVSQGATPNNVVPMGRVG